MITEQALREAIAECQGQRNPNANTAIKLAAFLTIQRELYGEVAPQAGPVSYSYSSAETQPVNALGDSEFFLAIAGKDQDAVWRIMDDLMNTLAAIMPRLYNAVLRELDFLA